MDAPDTPLPPGSPVATPGTSRRDFIKVTSAAATAGATVMIVPRHVLGMGQTPPSDLLNIATVGIAGQGGTNTQAVMSQNIVAICDCDDALLDTRLTGWKNAANPPAATGGTAGRQGGAGGRGAGPGGQGGAPASPFQNFGRSVLQAAANTKWTPVPTATNLRRFVDEQLPRLKRYRDYREMLQQQRDIDAVIIATPDHMHAPIASAAMALGKHVYVQKPLCWSVHEARFLAKKAADNPKLVTQMGNQGHSRDDARRGQDYLAAGAIGDITEVHVWTDRPFGYWPQGVPRPASAAPGSTVPSWRDRTNISRRLANALSGSYPVPDTLGWNLFLGAAPVVDYHPLYHPFNWRGWVDWGQGALGDMGAHLIDHPVWGLDLGWPTTIETTSTPFDGVCYPIATTTHYHFPARGARPAVNLIWYDGGLRPARPEELGEERLSAEGGVLYIGTKGKMIQNTYGANPRLLPADRHNSYGAPPEKMARVPNESHEMNWVNAIKGTDTAACPFSYAARLNEIMLLGVAALRANRKLVYDGANMRVTNSVDANQFLTRTYREGFGLT
jgi:predicted dehydrogenase